MEDQSTGQPGARVRATRVREVSPGQWEYSDGSTRNENGALMRVPPYAQKHAITSESARDMHAARRQRRAEAREKLRQAIVAETRAHAARHNVTEEVMAGLEKAPEAAAYAAGLLWREIVLNPVALGRDRRETFRDLTQEADLLGRLVDEAGDEETITVTIPRQMVAQLRDMILERLAVGAGQIIDGSVDDGDDDG